jgi:hypothetical protein
MINSKDIVALRKILAGIETSEDYSKVVTELKAAGRNMQRDIKQGFSIGDRVSFSGKRGGEERGEIIKINPKTIVVKTDFVTWKVSPSLLKKVS